ncbi:MAG: S24/S26 family peptidase [Thermoanaerobaculales bacterium]|nr:S24/S26 family peptidase [Thermoanaerobaculales bacterium]
MPEPVGRLRFQPVLRALLNDGQTVRFEAPGRSMLPTIHDGDSLVVAPVDPASISRGDVIVVEGPNCVRAHRVVGEGGRSSGTFLLRGDALLLRDAPVSPERVLGRVAGVERNGRRYAVQGPVVRARVFLRRSLVAVRRCLPDPRRWFDGAGSRKGRPVGDVVLGPISLNEGRRDGGARIDGGRNE